MKNTLYRALLQAAFVEFLRQQEDSFSQPLEFVGRETTDYLPHVIGCRFREGRFKNYYFLEEEPGPETRERMEAFAKRYRAEVCIIVVQHLPATHPLSS